MPTTGWPTCASRFGSARPWPLPVQTTPTSSRSAHIRCSPTPSPKAWSPSGPAAIPRWCQPSTVTTQKRSPSTRTWPPCGRRWVWRRATGRAVGLVDIPPTPWMHSKYWVANRADGRQLTGAHPLLGVHVEMPSGRDHVWQADVGTDLLPWLEDHKVHGQPVMPAAAFAEIALAAGSEAFGLPADAVEVNRLEVEQMLPIGSQTQLTTSLNRTADDSVRVEVHSRSTGGNWCRHAVARVDVAQRDVDAQRTGSSGETATVMSPADFYVALRRTGAHHGRAFAALTRIARSPSGFAETEIVLPDEATAHRGFRIHPVMLDSALQTLAAAMPAESLENSTEVTYLPVAIETIRLLGDVGRRARCRAELISVDDAGARGADHPDGRHGDADRPNHRRLPATHTTPNNAVTAGAKGLRHRLAADLDLIGNCRSTGILASRKLAGADPRPRHKRPCRGFHNQIRLTDPACDHRGSCR